MLISVIIPAYNVEHYLRQCVDSVLAQTYKNIEIIIVNDGSTDGTAALADEIVSSCHDIWPNAEGCTISVVHKPNGGLSDARNAGLRVAKGEYVAFLDADDIWLDRNGLKTLVSGLRKKLSDIMLFLREDIYPHTTTKSRYYDVEFINNNKSDIVFQKLVLTERFDMSACFQLLKRQFLIDNDLFFEVGLLSEDVDWSLRLWSALPSVQAINIYMYGYQHRSGSISTNYSLKNLKCYDMMFDKWNSKNVIANEAVHKTIRAYLANLYVSCLYAYRLIPQTEKKEAQQILKKYVVLLKFAQSPKSMRIKKIYTFTNFDTVLFLCQVYTLVKYFLLRVSIFKS